MINESGKSHRLVVPYTDENGIPQEPRFGISSFRGKAIREWAAKLYRQVVDEKKDTTRIPSKEDINLAEDDRLDENKEHMVNYLENDESTQQARIPVSAAPITIFGEQVTDEDSINSKPVEEAMKLTKEETSGKTMTFFTRLK